MVRFDPEAAEAKRREAAEKRHVDVHVDEVSFDGTIRVDAEVDLADALDLEDALRLGAKQQADLGSTESLDVRRAKALGDLARRQLAFGFEGAEPGRAVDLVVHISEDALTGTETVGRCGNTRSPISVEQIREWCANPNTKVTVKPVVDLADHIHVEAYEAPDRLKDQNALVDVHCVFPHCTKPARRCDTDHVIPHAEGGPTYSTNTAPLCRRHHRAKTHSPWDYTVIDRGTYLWTTPQRTQADPRPPRHAGRTLTTTPHTPARNCWPGKSVCPGSPSAYRQARACTKSERGLDLWRARCRQVCSRLGLVRTALWTGDQGCARRHRPAGHALSRR